MRSEPRSSSSDLGPSGETLYRFEGFELDCLSAQLRCGGKRVAITPPALGVLMHLVRNRGRIVAQQELLKAAWADTAVTDNSLRVAIHEIRQVLGDAGRQQRLVQTVRGRGYRFVGAVSARAVSAPGEASRTLGDLCGRTAELAMLREALARASERGRACVLVGPPGVGKSRLARELLAHSEELGFRSAEGHTDPEGSSPPFGLWMRLLAHLLQQAAPATLQRCEQNAPLAFRAFATQAPLPSIAADGSPEQLRAQLFSELEQLFITLSNEEGPLLLLLDDLHWADESSLAFFAHFSRLASRGRLLLLATCRQVPARENRPLARALESFAREPLNARIEITNLTVDAIEELLQGAGGGLARSAAEIHALTQGNPLFCLEVARLLQADEGCQRARLLAESDLELRTVVRRRLRALSSKCASTVLKASVLGPDFSVAELAAVLDVEPQAALPEIDACIEAGVMVELGNGRLRLPHPLVRDAAYEELSKRERSELHRLFAEWLERRGENPGTESLAQLAYHYHRAAASGVAEKAVCYARRCAERAAQTGAPRSAVTYYDHALECGDLVADFAPHTRLALEIERAKALLGAGTTSAAKTLLIELAEQASSQRSTDLFARAVLAYSGQSQTGFSPTRFAPSVDATEIRLLEQALEMLGEQASEQRVLLLCSLGSALVYSTDRARRERACQAAVELARTLSIPWLLARALMVRAYACAAPDNLANRLAACDELVAVVEANGLRELEVEARMARAVCHLERCDLTAAVRDEARAVQLARVLRMPRLDARAELVRLLRAFARADFDTVEQLAGRAIEQCPNDLLGRALFTVRMMGVNMLRSGEVEGAMALLQQMVAAYPETVGLRCALASSLASLGYPEQAREQFDLVAADDFSALPADINWLAEMSYLADTAVHLEDEARAAALYPKLLPYAQRWIFFGGEATSAGPVAHWLAELATVRGDLSSGEQWLAQSRALCMRMEAPLFLQYAALAEVRLRARAGATLSDPRLSELLRGVRDFAETHGVRWLLTITSEPERLNRKLRPVSAVRVSRAV